MVFGHANIMIANEKLKIVEISRGNSHLITAAATTICRAFSEDPLIRWLRPGAMPWGRLQHQTIDWQRRRVERACVEYRVFAINSISYERGESDGQPTGLPAIGFLCPPTTGWFHYLLSLPTYLRLYLLDFLWPVHDNANMQRVQIMMTNHEYQERIIGAIANRPPWYIEVVAVDPSQQGMKLGSKMLEHLIGSCPAGEPIFLECTDERNVGFYEKFGFRVINTTTLTDSFEKAAEGVNLWPMVKI